MNLKESLEKKKFIVTSEIQAPLGDDDPEELIGNLKKNQRPCGWHLSF